MSKLKDFKVFKNEEYDYRKKPKKSRNKDEDERIKPWRKPDYVPPNYEAAKAFRQSEEYKKLEDSHYHLMDSLRGEFKTFLKNNTNFKNIPEDSFESILSGFGTDY